MISAEDFYKLGVAIMKASKTNVYGECDVHDPNNRTGFSGGRRSFYFNSNGKQVSVEAGIVNGPRAMYTFDKGYIEMVYNNCAKYLLPKKKFPFTFRFCLVDIFYILNKSP